MKKKMSEQLYAIVLNSIKPDNKLWRQSEALQILQQNPTLSLEFELLTFRKSSTPVTLSVTTKY